MLFHPFIIGTFTFAEAPFLPVVAVARIGIAVALAPWLLWWWCGTIVAGLLAVILHPR